MTTSRVERAINSRITRRWSSFGWLRTVWSVVTTGAFIIHVYMGTAVVRGGFNSVIRGEVSTPWARFHHRLWLNRITGETAAKK